MVLIICLILFIWGIYGLASDYDHEAEGNAVMIIAQQNAATAKSSTQSENPLLQEVQFAVPELS